jgi:hypothetical protein
MPGKTAAKNAGKTAAKNIAITSHSKAKSVLKARTTKKKNQNQHECELYAGLSIEKKAKIQPSTLQDRETIEVIIPHSPNLTHHLEAEAKLLKENPAALNNEAINIRVQIRLIFSAQKKLKKQLFKPNTPFRDRARKLLLGTYIAQKPIPNLNPKTNSDTS